MAQQIRKKSKKKINNNNWRLHFLLSLLVYLNKINAETNCYQAVSLSFPSDLS